MKRIVVKTKNFSYPVLIGENIVTALPELVESLGLYSRLFVLIDSKVDKLYGGKFRKTFSKYAEKIFFHSVISRESSKSFLTTQKIYNELFENKFGRDTLFVTIGGGVVGDLGGFAAATYMRGLQLVHIPTTLMAAVDSSIGGKTAINLYSKKNIIGSFHQPHAVIIDPSYFNSLPKREIQSGLGEIIKYAYISDEDFFNCLESNIEELTDLKPEIVNKVLYESASIKAAVVSKDEKEEGLRKILNFGHTFAHAFESYFNYKIEHGTAVIAGIIAALYLSYKNQLIDITRLNKLLSLCSKVPVKISFKDVDHKALIEIMKSDKKSRGGKTKFVLIQDIGKIVIDVEVKSSDIKYALKKMNNFFVPV